MFKQLFFASNVLFKNFVKCLLDFVVSFRDFMIDGRFIDDDWHKKTTLFLLYLGVFLHLFRVLTGEAWYFYLGSLTGFIGFLLNLQRVWSHFSTMALVCLLPGMFTVNLISNGALSGLANFTYITSSIFYSVAIIAFGLKRSVFVPLFYLLLTWAIFEKLTIGGDFGEFLPNSRNHVFVVFLGFYLHVLLSDSINRESLSMKGFMVIHYIPIVVLFAISLATIGSMNIICSGILLIGFTVYMLMNFPRNLIANSLIFLLFLVTFFIIINLLEPNFGLLLEKMNIDRLFGNDVRYRIWDEYFRKANIFLGADYSQDYYYHSNLHNSFVLAHAKFGVFSVVFLYLWLRASLTLFFRTTHDKLLALVLIVLFFRACSDTIFFSGSSYDYLLFSLFLICAIPNKDRI